MAKIVNTTGELFVAQLPQISTIPAQSMKVLPGIVCFCMKAKLHGTTISGIGCKAAR
ncbi:MAG: hypothetical protein JJU33_04015 [Phycisphaerales bacterium]|nr:hypothetical protein [Phycisphaerales bacterium]